MALTRDDVTHIAALAHLELSEAELTLYQEQLSAILEYAGRLQALDTAAISPTATVSPLRSVLREDMSRAGLTREDALSNAPQTEAGCFVVPPSL